MSAARDRRNSYRRIDDVVDALAQLNLVGACELPQGLAERLVAVGIDDPLSRTTAQLLHDAWVIQKSAADRQPSERRRRERRITD